LKTHQVNTIVLPTDNGMGLRIRKATAPEAIHQEIYEKLGIAAEIMRPAGAWPPPKRLPNND
jgi:hypothetical protein